MDEKIVDKIKKLLRLAESADVNEAANAAGKAQQMMEAHNIDLAMLPADDDGNPIEEEEVRQFDHDEALHVSARVASWHSQLSHRIAKSNGCSTFLGYTFSKEQAKYMRTVGIVGRPSDVATVRYLFQYLKAEIDRLCKQSAKGKGRTWANSFRLGAVHEVGRRLKEAKAEARREARDKVEALDGDQTTALARLDTALARIDQRLNDTKSWMDENMNLRNLRSRGSQRDWDAYSAGREAGSNISLGAGGGGVGSGGGSRALGEGKGDK